MSESADLTAKYQLDHVLGWTPTARTFQGVDPETSLPVAVKLLSLARAGDADSLRERFEQTAAVLRLLSHPTLPTVVAHGVTPSGDVYLVSEWVEGQSLSPTELVPPERLLPWVLEIVEGLESLSLHGLVHLNLRPENLLIGVDGHCRILGWGSSLLMVDWQSGAGVGATTVEFGAPELRESSLPADALWRADAYSLAALTARLLGARIEERGNSPRVRFDKELSDQLQRAEVLREMLERCMRRSPEDRPDSYSGIARAVQHALPRDRRDATQETQPFDRVEATERVEAVENVDDVEAVEEIEDSVERPDAHAHEPQDAEPTHPSEQSGEVHNDVSHDDLAKTAVLPVARLQDTHRQDTETPDRELVAAIEAAQSEEALFPERARSLSKDDSLLDAALSVEQSSQIEPRKQTAKQGEKSSAVLMSDLLADVVDGPEVDQAGSQHDAGSKTIRLRSEVTETVAQPKLSAEPEPPEVPELPDVPELPKLSELPEQKALPSPASASPASGTATSATATSVTAKMATAPQKAGAPPPSEPQRPAAVFADLIARLSSLGPVPLIAGAGFGVVLLGWLVLFLVRGGERAPDRREPVASNEVVEVPSAAAENLEFPADSPLQLPPELVSAVEALNGDQLLEARRRLQAVEELEEQGQLEPRVWSAYRATAGVLVLLRRDALIEQLRAGLRDVKLPALRLSLRQMDAAEARALAAMGDGSNLVARAREWLSRADEFERSLQASAGVEALRNADRLSSELPELARTLDARNRAVESIDASVALLLEAGRLEEARTVLGDLEQVWPDRPMTARRLQLIKQRMLSKDRFDTLLAEIEATGRRDRPHEGLVMLSRVEPPEAYAARFAQLQETLTMQLQELDQQPPTLALDQSRPIEFRKGEAIVVELLASDDYEVREVGVEAKLGRQEAVHQLAVESLPGGRYRVVLEPSMHEDRPVFFWAWVRDRSGNRTRVGSEQQPIEVKRRRWFRRLGGDRP